ncbi:MAG: DUF1385 domain-containing protein [Candidatus Sericytochromatia bacterium]|nr:DUF1385 domain-containing protein [Candidatus Sericytochromatia bacterium]
MATGAMLATCNFFIIILLDISASISGVTLSPAWRDATGMLFFLALIRLSPLAGYHAAEHQTVHALEQGLPLTPACVVHQPRAHLRCGTNLMAYMLVFQAVLFAAAPLAAWDLPLVLLAALGVAGPTHRRLGFILQQLVTTKPASTRQIASALFAARALLASWSAARPVPRWLRVWRLGLVQVVGGALLTMWGLMALF